MPPPSLLSHTGAHTAGRHALTCFIALGSRTYGADLIFASSAFLSFRAPYQMETKAGHQTTSVMERKGNQMRRNSQTM